MELFFEILLAVFAVFGLWCAMRLITQAILCSSCITMAVTVSDREAEQELQTLLEQARAMLSYRRRMRIVVLYRSALLEQGVIPPEQMAVIQRFGAVCHIVDRAAESDGNKEEI